MRLKWFIIIIPVIIFTMCNSQRDIDIVKQQKIKVLSSDIKLVHSWIWPFKTYPTCVEINDEGNVLAIGGDEEDQVIQLRDNKVQFNNFMINNKKLPIRYIQSKNNDEYWILIKDEPLNRIALWDKKNKKLKAITTEGSPDFMIWDEVTESLLFTNNLNNLYIYKNNISKKAEIKIFACFSNNKEIICETEDHSSIVKSSINNIEWKKQFYPKFNDFTCSPIGINHKSEIVFYKYSYDQQEWPDTVSPLIDYYIFSTNSKSEINNLLKGQIYGGWANGKYILTIRGVSTPRGYFTILDLFQYYMHKI